MVGTRIFRKLFSLVAVLAVAVSVFGAHSLADAEQRRAGAEELTQGLDAIEAAALFMHELQQERGLTTLLLDGASGMALREELDRVRQRSDAALAAYAKVPRRTAARPNDMPRSAERADIPDLPLRVQALRQAVDAGTQDADAAFERYSRWIAACLRTIADVTVRSRVDTLARPLTAHLALARAKEYAGQERALLGRLMAMDASERTSQVKDRWADLVTLQNELLDLEFLEQAEPGVAAAYRAVGRNLYEIQRVRNQVLNTDGAAPDALEVFRMASVRIDALAATELFSLQQLRAHADNLIRQERLHMAGLATVMLLTVGFLFVYARYVSAGIARPVEALLWTIHRLEQEPEVVHRVPLDARDELREVAVAFNRLQDLHQADGRELRLAASVFEHAIEGVLVANERGTILSINAAYGRIMGYAPSALVGRNVRVLKSGRQPPAFYTRMRKELAARGHWRGELWNRRQDGAPVLVDLSVSAVRDPHGRIVRYVGISSDITEQRETQLQHQKALQHHRAILAALGEGVYGLDRAGRLTFLNPAGERLLGWREEELKRRPVHEIIHGHDDLGVPVPRAACPLLRTMESRAAWRGEQMFVHRDNHHFMVECISTPIIEDGAVTGTVVAFSDISARKAAEAEIHFMAYHDMLTGLPNRRYLVEELERAIAGQADSGRMDALLFVDLDRFKQVNDSLGHPIGDALLIEVAARLRTVLCSEDFLAREGGDEFIIFMRGTAAEREAAAAPDPLARAQAEITGAIERILAQFRQPFTGGGHEIYFAASIGVTFLCTRDTDAVTLLREADEAMYRAKAAGGNQAMFHRPSALEHTATRLSLENRLHKALEQAQFLIHFQPVVDLASGRMLGAEALIRWQEGGRLVPPGDFIPVAEDSGLIVPIGAWVIRESCRHLAEWRRVLPDFHVAINLSPRQFARHDLVESVRTVLREFELPPDAIEFEITETAGINLPEETRRQVLALHELGLRLAIDDFGTGHSSLTRLQELPIDTLKIDRSFVQSLPDITKVNTRIVRNTIQLAADLGLIVVAEGVETAAQWRYLAEQGAQLAQGYLFSAPLPAAGFTTLLERARDGAVWCLEGLHGAAPEGACLNG